MPRLRTLAATLAVAFGLALAAPAQAQTLTFDDITCGMSSVLPANYGGFAWGARAYCTNSSEVPSNTGYATVGGGTNVLFGAFGNPFNMTAANPFSVQSFRVAPAFNDNLSFSVVGLLDGVQQFSMSQQLTGPFTAQTVVLNWANIDELQFSSTGGALNPQVDGQGVHFAIDDMVFGRVAVPEPGSAVLMMTAVFGFAAMRRRRV